MWLFNCKRIKIKGILISSYVQGVPKKKHILNIHIKSEGINIFTQKLGWIEITIFVVKCLKFNIITQLFM